MTGRVIRGRGFTVSSDIPPVRTIRGRGRMLQSINTIPENVHTTTGEGGSAIPLVSNCFKLNTPKDQLVYTYRVDFEPLVESVRIKRQLIAQQRELFGSVYVFDGGDCIFSIKKLESEVTTVTGTRLSDNEQVCITFRYTSKVTWGHPQMIQFYNVQMKRIFRNIGMIQIGRNYYDKHNSKVLSPWKSELMSGIATAINEHDGGILMMCNTVHKVIRSETAYDMLQEILKADRNNFRSNARRDVPGKIVKASYNDKTYRIDDMIFDKNPITYTFERRGLTVTLKDYYKEQHDVTVKDDRQPLLLVKPTQRRRRGGQDQPIVLIPELCYMTGLTDQMRKNFQLKRDMKNVTCTEPKETIKTLENFVSKLDLLEKENESGMKTWGIKLDSSPIELPGRVLPAEKILMLGEDVRSGTQYNQKSGSFEREIRFKNLRKPVGLDRWAIICPKQFKQILDEYCDTLRQVAQQLGVALSPPKIVFLDDFRPSTYVKACEGIPLNCQLVNVIVPNDDKDRYDAIKKVFCCEHPMASQVVTIRVLQRENTRRSICTKICIQMSVKLGAEAWTVNIPPENLMIAGYDCYYDSTKGSTVGALVCSLNRFQTRWYSRASYCESTEKISSNISMHLIGSLKEYHSLNGRYPDRLILYRAGISEGQIPYIYETEMAQVKAALDSIIEPGKIRWAYILVTKGGNARLFHKTNAQSLDNPPPGTIVDTMVTRKERYDFYLISQSVRQGTVNPTMYNIIEDTTGWKPIHHQQLAYKLCHLYFNWTGTISVPAACQYAQKLANLTATVLHQEPDPRLGNYLFYL